MKLQMRLPTRPNCLSPPAWGAWIETLSSTLDTVSISVAPRVGGVD